MSMIKVHQNQGDAKHKNAPVSEPNITLNQVMSILNVILNQVKNSENLI